MNKIRKQTSLKQKAYLVFFYLPLLTLFFLILTSSLSFAAMDSATKQIEVDDGMLVLQILNEEFTRGGSGKVWFTLENTGEEEIEILTSRNSGNSASNQVTYSLVDEDDNMITSKAFKQGLGEGVITLSNKNTVARIPAGGTFTSAVTDIDVPANAPDNVTVRLGITKIYFHHGRKWGTFVQKVLDV